MKRRNLFLITLILAICMLSQGVMANWTPYTGQSTQPARVKPYYNSNGQNVYEVYDAWGTLVMDIRTRNGNIWNETTKVLYTQTNKGPTYIGITPELEVYGLTQEFNASSYSNPVKYRKGFLSGEIPYINTSLQVNTNMQATGFQLDSNGFCIGIYTTNGVYNISSNNFSSNGNYQQYDYNSYPRVTQQRNEYYYYYRSNSYYTLVLNDNGKLKNNNTGTNVSSISEINFAPGYVIAVTTSGKVKQLQVSNLTTEETYNDEFYDWKYWTDENGNSWVRGYIDVDGDTHYFDIDDQYYDDYWYDEDDDDYWYDDDDDYWYDDDNRDYPYFYQSGTNKYMYHASSSREYEYTLSSAGKLSYDGDTISTDVVEVWFAKGYIVFIVYDEDDEESICYKSKLGSTTKTKVCTDFEEFEYDGDGFAIEAVSTSGRSYDL